MTTLALSIDNLSDGIFQALEEITHAEDLRTIITESIDNGTGLTKQSASIVLLSLESMRNRLGIKEKIESVAVEAFTSHSLQASKIALEGLGDFLIKIWEGILKAIRFIIDKVKSLFGSTEKRIEKQAEKNKEQKKELQSKGTNNVETKSVKDIVSDHNKKSKEILDKAYHDAHAIINKDKPVNKVPEKFTKAFITELSQNRNMDAVITSILNKLDNTSTLIDIADKVSWTIQSEKSIDDIMNAFFENFKTIDSGLEQKFTNAFNTKEKEVFSGDFINGKQIKFEHKGQDGVNISFHTKDINLDNVELKAPYILNSMDSIIDTNKKLIDHLEKNKNVLTNLKKAATTFERYVESILKTIKQHNDEGKEIKTELREAKTVLSTIVFLIHSFELAVKTTEITGEFIDYWLKDFVIEI